MDLDFALRENRLILDIGKLLGLELEPMQGADDLERRQINLGLIQQALMLWKERDD